jgi:hypothetical protein
MVNQKLVDYIIEASRKGYDTASIKRLLLKQGWSEEAVNEAINSSGAGKHNNRKFILFLVIAIIAAAIIIFAITILPAMIASNYVSDFMQTYSGKTFTIPTGGAYCLDGIIHVRVSNTGDGIISSSDWIAKSVEEPGNEQAVGALSVSDVASKGNKDFTSDCGGGCVSGESYIVSIGTISGVQHIPMECD